MKKTIQPSAQIIQNIHQYPPTFSKTSKKKHSYIHSQRQRSLQNKTHATTNTFPQLWGCVLSRQLQTAQKYRLRHIRQYQTQNPPKRHRSHTTSPQASQLLLSQYLKRKQKKNQSEPKIFTNKQFYEIIEMDKSKKQKNIKLLTNFVENQGPLEKYFEIISLEKKNQKTDNMETHISKLKQLINWRKKIIMNIKNGVNFIKNSQ